MTYKFPVHLITDQDRNQVLNDLSYLLLWAEEWQMMFNVSKCKVMKLGYKN